MAEDAEDDDSESESRSIKLTLIKSVTAILVAFVPVLVLVLSNSGGGGGAKAAATTTPATPATSATTVSVAPPSAAPFANPFATCVPGSPCISLEYSQEISPNGSVLVDGLGFRTGELIDFNVDQGYLGTVRARADGTIVAFPLTLKAGVVPDGQTTLTAIGRAGRAASVTFDVTG